jgi:hypothetical protein
MQRLAFYSRQRLHQVTADLKLEYDRSDGYMVLLRSEKDRELTRPGLQVLRDGGGEVPRDRPGRGAQGRTRAECRTPTLPAPSTYRTTRSATAGSLRCC